MPELSLYYPVAPHHETRAWGVREARVHRHNGVDLALEADQAIRAPFACTVWLAGSRPGASEQFVSLLSKESYRFPDGVTCKVELTLIHLKDVRVREGDKLSAGDLIAHGTGSHLHIAPKRVKNGWFGHRDLDRNDADNTFDPTPYWNGVYPG